jgi:hypothetical protein
VQHDVEREMERTDPDGQHRSDQDEAAELSTVDLLDAGDRDRDHDRDEARETTSAEDTAEHLFEPEQVERFRDQWQSIQAEFVDDPKQAVQGADHLVAEVMRSLAATFNEHKQELEGQWQQGSEVETEDLRQALRRYRSLFNQLLNA